jgi:hypothetical protein
LAGAPGGRPKGRLTRIRLLWAKVASETATAEEDHGTSTSPFPSRKYISRAHPSHLPSTRSHTHYHPKVYSSIHNEVLHHLPRGSRSPCARTELDLQQHCLPYPGSWCAHVRFKHFHLFADPDCPVVPVLPRLSASLLRSPTPPTVLRSSRPSPKATRPSSRRTT